MPELNTIDELGRTTDWFRRAYPNPSTAQNISTQIGVHFEEVTEMIAEVTPEDMVTNGLLLDAKEVMQRLADHLKAHAGCITISDENREAFLDSLCDQIVTAVGSAYHTSMDISGAMDEVNRSNFSKFDENGQPIFNEQMKVQKGPGYVKADLTRFI